ncbi:MAG TPA: carboxypeptidase-like regulatory domain-containing protein [Pyrinomonadaceae bacterium]|nr:carboxypeptidase-like regulatory domain-containing protein [Pyrinomonadaceae bacterium]
MAGSISGKVTNASGGGMANVTVQATGGGGAPAAAQTNSSGNYQITNLNAGTYTVLVIPGAGTFTPPNFRVTITQNQNVTGRNFKQN